MAIIIYFVKFYGPILTSSNNTHPRRGYEMDDSICFGS